MGEQLRGLARKVPPALIGDNGRGFPAMDHAVVTQLLLAKLAGYSFEHVETLRSPTKKNPDVSVVTGVIMRLTCSIDGEQYVIEEAGGVENAMNDDGDGERMKKAMSDAWKRCAMRIGVGLHLWAGDHYFLDKMLSQPTSEDAAQGERQSDRTLRGRNSRARPDSAPEPEPERTPEHRRLMNECVKEANRLDPVLAPDMPKLYEYMGVSEENASAALEDLQQRHEHGVRRGGALEVGKEVSST